MSTRRRFGRLRRLPSGRWQARYATSDGVERTAPRTFGTKTEADRWLGQVETDLARGCWVDHRLGTVTIAGWAERYMATTAHLKPKTRASYGSLLRSTVLPTLGGTQVGELRQIAVGSGSLASAPEA